MRPLDDPQTLETARSAFERVFDPRWDVAPFRPQLPDRVLMYPVAYTMLEPEQFGAVAAAVDAATSETEAFLAALGEPGSGWGGTYDHAVVALGDYASYKPPDTLVLEHTLFSPSGAWGVMTSDIGFAAAAGSSVFARTLRAHLPGDHREMGRELIHDVRDMGEGGAYTGWLAPLVEHVFGPDASALLGPAPT